MIESFFRVFRALFGSWPVQGLIRAFFSLALCASYAFSDDFPANMVMGFAAEVRIGDSAWKQKDKTFEISLGDSEDVPSQTADFSWENGVDTPFRLSYDPTSGCARFALADEEVEFFTTAQDISHLILVVRATKPECSIVTHNLVLSDEPLAVDLTACAQGGDTRNTTLIHNDNPSSGFVLTGMVQMTFPTSKNKVPKHSQLSFQILAGTEASSGDYDDDGSPQNPDDPGSEPQDPDEEDGSDGEDNPTTPDYADSDGDGLSDDWESEQDMNPFDSSDAAEDSDGDGMTNYEEFVAGTDLHDPSSNLRLNVTLAAGASTALSSSGESTDAENVPLLFWPASEGKTYSVWRAETLAKGMAGFEKIAEGISSEEATAFYIDAAATAMENCYYRIQIENPAY